MITCFVLFNKSIEIIQRLEYIRFLNKAKMSIRLKFLMLFVPLCLFYVCTKFNSNSSTAVVVLFKANFSKLTLSKVFEGGKISHGNKNVKLWANGGGMDVVYPAGSHVPSGPIVGGVGIWTNHSVEENTAIFKYSVYFPDNFNFVRGGKLPGLYGGHIGCCGGKPANDCFSTRMMWRVDGDGELYLYANRDAQDPTICQKPENFCDPIFGWSLSTFSFSFPRAAWTRVEQALTLNTPGERDGILSVKINGTEVIRHDNIVFRTAQYPNVKVKGMLVDTFFGGNGPEWATPTEQMTKFKDFSLESY